MTVSNGCWAQPYHPSCQSWQNQGAGTSWGQYHLRRADPGCVQEQQAEAGSRLRPCQSSAVSKPKAEPLEGRTGAGGRTQAFTQAGRCLGRAGPSQPSSAAYSPAARRGGPGPATSPAGSDLGLRSSQEKRGRRKWGSSCWGQSSSRWKSQGQCCRAWLGARDPRRQ